MAPEERPNIVFVLTDDQGYGELGCHGNPVIHTPNMDALYRESVRLTDYHVGPTCAPTRAGLMTGHYHNSTGVWHTIGGRSLLRKDEWSLATALSEAGYVTGLFGKWHLGDNYPYRPQDRGFQYVVAHGGGGVGQTNDYWGNNYHDDTYAVNGSWQPFEGYCTDVWFNEALAFIERNRDRPFFCYISTNAPHSPYIVDASYSDPYVGKVEHEERARFYGMITKIDEDLGLLRQQLAAWGLADNTILIFMTDNGTSGGATLDADQFVVAGYNAGMRGIKGSEYEGGHRVPFFLHWPRGGLAEGRDVSQLTANVDIMPTLLELCGVDPGSHTFDGCSLVPLLYGRHEDWPDRIIVTDSQRLAHPVKWRKSATMTQRWRLINGRELYDIHADPEQRHDLAAAFPEVVARLRAGYERWWEKVSQQFDGTIPIAIGQPGVGTTLLTTHDWRNDPVACAWNQAQVRAGMVCNGYWEIDVARPGRYRFELRRWPRQENRGLGEGIPGPLKPFTWVISEGWGGGRALPLVRAGIRVGDFEAEKPIRAHEPYAEFFATLNAGETRLQTFLYDEAGGEIGAYFVYVDLIDVA
ncbi:MAG TPA: N-acetylgalactosamine-4-sulfatase [Chloroflexi bacterium]|nr:N-acetylgalactosamine-4-sulfatase [Chloroflexota bacterium]